MSLEVKSLRCKVGSFQLKAPDLKIEPGEIYCLIGKSGSGKSTFLNAISGFFASSGQVTISGVNVSRFPPEKRRIGFLFQRPALFPHLNLQDNIEFGLKLKGVSVVARRTLSSDWLKKIGLGGFERRRAWEISEGQAQRVAFARTLAVGFPVLLLDEPFSALDEKTRTELSQVLVDEVRGQGIASIMVTHQEEDAGRLGAKLVRMEG